MRRMLAAVAVPTFCAAAALVTAGPDLIPLPARMEAGTGTFMLTPSTPLLAEPGAAERVATWFAEAIAPATGFRPAVRAAGSDASPAGAVLLTTVGADASLGPEGYELKASPGGIVIRAPAESTR